MKADIKGADPRFVGPPRGQGRPPAAPRLIHGAQFHRISDRRMRDEAEIPRATGASSAPAHGKRHPGDCAAESNKTSHVDEGGWTSSGRLQRRPLSALTRGARHGAAQNTFKDHYIDQPFRPHERGLFILHREHPRHRASRPCADRMEVIRLAGYIEEGRSSTSRASHLSRGSSRPRHDHRARVFEDPHLTKLSRVHAEAGLRNLERETPASAARSRGCGGRQRSTRERQRPEGEGIPGARPTSCARRWTSAR